ncbi:hypothetical protein GCM10023084_39360 [Streptomyces lacrimifluminis]|uniref:Uncharacterized protein n=1 Tax=Streptomyces lacrimifluminis TaxID=1500077 RepID=A0A917NY81_9ACTN|nr:hypothetical protein GCM10012282_40980 [Streptomyces lacrimifluminis]
MAYGPLGTGASGEISTRPSGRVSWEDGGMAVGAVSVMGRPINEMGRERPCGRRVGGRAQDTRRCPDPPPGNLNAGEREMVGT